MSRSQHIEEGPGQDSFLDIVANVVGILIILVMVLGVQAKDAWQAADQGAETAETGVTEADVESAAKEARGIEHDVNRLAAQAIATKKAAALRAAERNKLLGFASLVRREVSQIEQKLDSQQRKAIETDRAISEVEARLIDLRRADEQLKSKKTKLVIEHLPTPMAKTVFGQEVHFRLLKGRLVYVPLEELVELMKADIPQHVNRLRQASRVVETVGPVSGFRLQYHLERRQVAVQTQLGTARRETVQLAGFALMPEPSIQGETLDQALSRGSIFRRRLERLDPRSAVITIWTYPDSFDEFRQLKKELFQAGFATAARPLPHGTPIMGSPQGTRSAAQ